MARLIPDSRDDRYFVERYACPPFDDIGAPRLIRRAAFDARC